jgi:hypothetical protein
MVTMVTMVTTASRKGCMSMGIRRRVADPALIPVRDQLLMRPGNSTV